MAPKELRKYFGNWLLMLAVASTIALLPAWYVGAHIADRERTSAKVEFNLIKQTRVATLRTELSSRARALETVASIAPELQTNSKEQFQRVMYPLLKTLRVRSICWRNQDNIEYQVPDSLNDCDNFELFNSALVFDEESPKLMLTKTAGDRSSKNRGFVSVVMDASSLFSRVHLGNINESILLNDRTQQSLRRFVKRDNSFQLEPVGVIQTSPELSDYQSVLSLAGIDIIHRASTAGVGNIILAWQTAIIVWLVVFLLGLFVYFITWRNFLLDTEVAFRTEELSQFAYRTSHDLKSPLSSIKQLMNFVDEDVRAGRYEESLVDISRARSQAEKLEALVTNILNLAKADSLTSDWGEFSLSEQLKVFKELNFELIKNAEVNISQIDDDITILCNRVRLSQILENLLSNSIKYADQNLSYCWVKISLKQSEKLNVLTIEDNGVGLPAEFTNDKPEGTFKRYRPDLADGSGLGLSIVRRHVRKISGTLTFTPLAQGTRIVVAFPAIE